MIARGEIWWTDFGSFVGSEPADRRPAVVVQNDDFDASTIATVVVAPMTSPTRLADAPGNVLVKKDRSGLPKDSVVNVSQMGVVDRSRLCEYHGRLDAQLMTRVDRGLRLVLGL